LYQIEIQEKVLFPDRPGIKKESSYHHFQGPEHALRFLAALETPHMIFVRDLALEGLHDDLAIDLWREEERADQ
tara:strand:- start:243 stop:464 length:222 start_codon:yes stop_codon:yes gene_type:complete